MNVGGITNNTRVSNSNELPNDVEVQESERSLFEQIQYFYSPQKDIYISQDSSNFKEGQEFLEGITKYEDKIRSTFNMSEEKYDAFTCLALGIAARETDTGEDKEYQSENGGVGKFFRFIGKQVQMGRGADSASSGITQMKIYDFLNSNRLTSKEVEFLKNVGIDVQDKFENNLYEKPDLAAVATLVVLNNINNNYQNYEDTVKNENSKTRERLDKNLTDEQCYEKGGEILNKFVKFYQGVSKSDDKIELRSYFREWLMSANGSTIDQMSPKDKMNETAAAKYIAQSLGQEVDSYNEEYNLKELNEKLSKMNAGFEFSQSDLDYMRYYLSNDENKMSRVEYCAYGWNRGTGSTGMQFDRLLDGKIESILKDPEKFEYSQYIPCIVELSRIYAQQFDDKIDFAQALS